MEKKRFIGCLNADWGAQRVNGAWVSDVLKNLMMHSLLSNVGG